MTQVRSSVGMTKEFPVKVGLHQGSAISPYLFDPIMDVLVEDVKKEAPWNMIFAVDVFLCEQSTDRLEENLLNWRMALEERGMKISRTNSEYLALKDMQTRSCKIQDDELKSVCKFNYLGSYIQRDEELESEIQHRINCGWNNWRKMSGVLCDKKVSIGLKGKVYKSVVRPAMIYGAETWLIIVAQERKMEVAEMRILRWVCGVTRKDRIKNEFVRGAVKVGLMGGKDTREQTKVVRTLTEIRGRVYRKQS
ncbi:uncharacterized protein LOC124622894 [Schistocerca americana]|uniref:uncharacterized protein LOC124622894 n=1 Tax=Schistocerca americana TaxID=7009 RepID=UPI001F4FA6C2|nr:uncharacterized protein LOC124622894 [Schistocerca americana]